MSKFSKKLISSIVPAANTAGVYSAVEQLQNLNALAITAVNVCADSSGTDGGLGDDTAVNTAGGFVKLTGSGFTSATIVYINGTSVTKYYLNNTTIVATVPAATAGTTASLMVFNGSTVGSIWAAGISYSGFPSWTTTAASNAGLVVSTQLVAVGDAPLVYTFVSGTLPPNCTISSSGLLSGTVTGVSTNTIYTFTVAVTDAQNQNVSQSIVYTLVVTDTFYRYTSLHISGDSNPTWITDASTNALAVTPAGAPQSTIFSPLKAGYYGNSFNGSSDWLSIPLTAGLTLGSGDFTIEAWIYKNTSSAGEVFGKTGSVNYAIDCQTIAGNYTNITLSSNGTATTNVAGATALATNRWYHVAWVRSGTTINIYLNGVLDGTGVFSGAIFSGSNVDTSGIGARPGGGTVDTWFNGSISNLRVVKGTAVYTANFTPSATPLTAITNTSLLTCQSARFIDKSAIDTTYTVTNSGASAYTINGSSNPTLNLVRGFTYYFNVNASGHPFWIKTTNVTGTGSAYSSGVTNNGVDYGTVTFTVPLDAPSTLYYICQIHSSMVGSFAISDGIAITATGTPKIVSSNPFNLPSGLASYGAGYFNGTTDYVTIPNNAVFALPSDYTIEFWWHPTSLAGNPNVFCLGSQDASQNGLLIYYGSADSTLRPWSNNATIMTPVASGIIVNTWCHIALVRSGSGSGNTVLYVNGVSIGSATNTTSFTGISANGLVINATYSGSAYSIGKAGYFSNFRVIKGTAVYTAAFTPPTAPLTAITNTSLLTLQTNVPHNNSQFRDTSTNNAVVTRVGNTTQGSFSPFTKQYPYSTATVGGSAYFDGTLDCLSLPSNTAWALGTTFTIEAWIYIPATPSTNLRIVSVTNNGVSIDIFVDSSNRMNVVSPSGAALTFATSALTLGTWTHIALVANSGTILMYYNGVSQSLSGTTTGFNYTNTSTIQIGGLPTTSGLTWYGYISNLRIVKGTALYTSNFTPSTAPLTAVSGTVLLMPFTNAAVYDNTMLSNLETVGNVQANTSVFKYGTGALKFNGTTDYLTIPNNSNFSFGTGDFTIEMWVYASSFSGYRTLIDARGSDSTVAYGLFLETTSGQLYWYDGSASQTSSSGPPLNTWTHIAAVRTSGVLKMFVAGVQVYSAANTNAQNPTGPLLIGKNIGSSSYFNGYIDELRITKGYARYTAAFTPSTGAFSASAPFGTSVLPSKSLRFRASASAYLSRTPAVAGNQKTWTWSGWVKRGTLGVYAALFAQGTGSTGSGYGFIRFDSNDTLSFTASADGNTASATWASTPVYRDPAAWYHVVAVLDTTQATSSNRFKLYVNGVLQSGTFSTAPGQNADIQLNRAALHQIGVTYASSFANYLDGELAEVNFVDGLALDPTMFGAYSAYNQWLPVSYSGYMGANGFYLPFNAATATTSANYLVVAGGGGGGTYGGGGGGGGGFRTATGVTLDPTTVYAVTVGAGGTGPSALNVRGGLGGDSSFNALTSTGGGGGGTDNLNAGTAGGSGGGAALSYNTTYAGGAASPVTSPVQGYAGAGTTASGGSFYNASGGGGGASAAGTTGSTVANDGGYGNYGYGTSGNGGAGAVSSISGTSVTYAGGGGGGGASTGAAYPNSYYVTAGTGGAGGGGNGTMVNSRGIAGTTNLGGGGGGGGMYAGGITGGGAGGAGVVIISYSGTQKFYGGNITSVGGNTIHTFTTSGSLTGVFGDQSGNNNSWTPNNINVSTVGPTYDLLTDVPTLTSATAANYAVLNSLSASASPKPSDGNLTIAFGGTYPANVLGSIGVNTGKWYWEVGFAGGTFSNGHACGIAVSGWANKNTDPDGVATPYSHYVDSRGYFVNNGTQTSTSINFGAGDIISIALNCDTNVISFYKNNTLIGSAQSIESGQTWFPFHKNSSYTALTQYANFGQQPFTYTPPANFLALNTYNI